MFTSVHTAELTLRRLGATGLIERICTARRLRRELIAFGNLDARLLSDVGLTRQDAEVELRRPVWDVAAHWRR